MTRRRGVLFGFVAALCLSLAGLGAPALAQVCSGCGCKGGPGYREPSGKCATWKTLAAVCGNPPSTRCKAEGPNRGANEVAAGSRFRTGGGQ